MSRERLEHTSRGSGEEDFWGESNAGVLDSTPDKRREMASTFIEDFNKLKFTSDWDRLETAGGVADNLLASDYAKIGAGDSGDLGMDHYKDALTTVLYDSA